MERSVSFVLALLVGHLLGGSAHAAPAKTGKAASRGSVEVEMRNVDMRLTEDVTLRIHALRGRFTPTKPGTIPNLDDVESFVVEVDSGEVAMGEASLNAM